MAKYGDYDGVSQIYGDEVFLVVQQPRDAQGQPSGNPTTLNVTPAQLKAFFGSGNVAPNKYSASIQPGTLTMLGDKVIANVTCTGVKTGDVLLPVPTGQLPAGLMIKQAVVTAPDTISVTVSALAALTLGTTAIPLAVIAWR